MDHERAAPIRASFGSPDTPRAAPAAPREYTPCCPIDGPPERAWDPARVAVGALSGVALTAFACVGGVVANMPWSILAVVVTGGLDGPTPAWLEPVFPATFGVVSLLLGAAIGRSASTDRRRGARQGAGIVAFALVTGAGTALSPAVGPFGAASPWAAGLGAAALAGAVLWGREGTWTT